MARPNYNLRESLYPALGALGTYTSNLAQYSGQMTPYKRDPRLDQQRAFGDALMAYMRSVPQREQMFQNRQQLAIDRKRQKEIDDRQRKLFPYQLEQAQREKRLQELQLKGEEQKQNIANRWTEIVSASGATPTEKQRLMQLGPSAGFNLLQKITSRVEKRQLTDDEVLSLPSEMQKYEKFLQYDGSKIVPTVSPDVFKEIIKSGRQGNILSLEQKREVFKDQPDSVLNGIVVSKDPSQASGYSIVRLPNQQKALDANQQLIARAQNDNDLLATAEYATVFTNTYEKADFADFKDPNSGVVTKKPVYKPVPNSIKLPTHPNWVPTNPHLKSINKQKGEQAINERVQPEDISYEVGKKETITKTYRTDLQKKRGVSILVQKAITRLDNNLKNFGAQATGTNSAIQESVFADIENKVRQLDGMGVPNGPDLMLSLRKLMNPTKFGVVDYITNPIETIGRLYKTANDPTNYIRKQLEEMMRQVKISVASINYELETGKPLSLEELKVMEATGQLDGFKPIKEFDTLNKSEQKKRIARPPNG